MRSTQSNEELGKEYFSRLLDHITQIDGQFARDESGQLWLIGKGLKVPLTNTPDNHPLVGLMLTACDVSMQSPAARAAIERLRFEAYQKAGKMHLKRFSAISRDGRRLYVPITGGQVLQISSDLPNGHDCSANGENQDHFWIAHPKEDPLNPPKNPVAIRDRLADFERLCVETQASVVPSLRWLVAMHMGFFPYVRDLCSARFLLQLNGHTQAGKTTGAQRFTLLHGLGRLREISPSQPVQPRAIRAS